MNDEPTRPQGSRGILRALGWAVAGGYAAQGIALAIFLLLSRLVGPEAFGAVAVSIILIELCRAAAIETTVANLMAQHSFNEEQFNAGFVWAISTALILCVGLVVFAPALAWALHLPALSHVLPQLAVLLLIQAGSRLHEARLVQQMRFRALAARTIAGTLIGGAVGLAAALAQFNIEALIWQQWAGASAAALLLWLHSDWRPRLSFSRKTFIDLARGNLAMAPANLITNLSAMLDGIVAASIGGAAGAGAYNLGKRIRVAMQMALSSALDRVSLPAFARLRHEQDRLSLVLKDTLRLGALAAFPIFLGLAAIAPDIIEALLGPQWSAAGTPAMLLLIGGALAVPASFCENALLVLDRRRWIIAVRGTALAALVILLLIFGRFGLDAVAACSLAASAIQAACAMILVARLEGASMMRYLRAVALPLTLGLAMFAILIALRQGIELGALNAVQRLILQIPLGAALYLAGVWLFARHSARAMIAAARAAL